MEALGEPSVVARNGLSDAECCNRIGGPFCQRDPDLRYKTLSGEVVLTGFMMPLNRST